MRKPERVKLHKRMRELLSRLGSEVKSFDELSMETVSLPGEYGRISIAFYNARDAKVAPWLPCRLIDWPAEVKHCSPWRGFRHRKQNLYFFDEVIADQAVDAAMEHLRKLGLSRQLAEVVDVAANR